MNVPQTDADAARLAARFRRDFPVRDPDGRTLGREGEHPVVHPDGTAADVAVLWPHLAAQPDAVTLYEGALVVGVRTPEVMWSAEVGRGTIEIIVGPCPDLHALRAAYERGMEAVVEAATREGLVVLGYGIQPVTPAIRPLMTDKVRYGVLLEALGDDWLSFAVTASDQLHVDVTASEAVPVTDLLNLLSPVVVALCANSPIAGGVDTGSVSTREARMGRIEAGAHRHGMIEGPSRTVDGWIGRTFGMRYLMARGPDGPEVVPGPTAFGPWLAAAGLDDDAAWDAWLLHEHYVWNAARPRAAHGTVELRCACQQPWASHDAVAALGTGLVAGHLDIADFVVSWLGRDPWTTLRGWSAAVQRDGLAAGDPVPGFVDGILARARDALMKRGRGEAPFLTPVIERWSSRTNPAQEARAAFAAGGAAALVEARRVG